VDFLIRVALPAMTLQVMADSVGLDHSSTNC